MEIEVTENTMGTRIRFSGNGTVDSAVQAKEAILKTLDTAQHLIMDVCGLKKVDISFLQVLIATEKSALDRGKDVMIDANVPSRLFIEALLRGGFCNGREFQVENHTHSIFSDYYRAVTQEEYNG